MTQSQFPSITVIVCTRDRPALLEQCLRSLSKQTYPNFEVLVVDNASKRSVHDTCRRWGAIYAQAPLPGLTRARNLGARLARGEIVAYIDDDAVADMEWLKSLADDFADAEVAAVTGGIRYMKARGNSRLMTSDEARCVRARPPRSFDRRTRDWFTLACFGGIGDGGNMAFRRKLIATVHPFDERLGCGRVINCGDEHVIFASLIASGYRIAHNPDAIVRHPAPPTPELQRARKLSDLRSSISYLLFVWGEFSAHRADILRFLSRAIRRRALRRPAGPPEASRPSRRQSLSAMLSGVYVYWKARNEWDVLKDETHRGATGVIVAGNFNPHVARR